MSTHLHVAEITALISSIDTLIDEGDPVAWQRMRQVVDHVGEPTTLQRWAHRLPRSLADLGDRAQRRVLELYHSLAPWIDDLPALGSAVPYALDRAWCSLALRLDPRRAGPWRPALRDAAILEAVEPFAPLDTIDALLAYEDADADRAALRYARTAVARGSAPERSLAARLVTLSGRGAEGTWQVAATLESVPDSVASPPLAAPATDHTDYLDLLVQRGAAAGLVQIANGDGPHRGPALVALGRIAGSAATLIGATPSGEGLALRDALFVAHRRGIFIRPEDLDSVVAWFVGTPQWAPRELAELCYVARAEYGAALLRAAVEAQHIERLARAAAASQAPDVDEVLDTLFEVTQDHGGRVGVLRTMGDRRSATAETRALAMLDTAPVTSLHVLARTGTQIGLEVLLSRLDRLPREALGTAWQLLRSDDDGARSELIAKLNPRALPSPVTRDLALTPSPSYRDWRLTLATTQRPDLAFVTVAALGEQAHLTALEGYFEQAWIGLLTGDVPPDVSGPQLVCPQRLVEAARGYGRVLNERGRVRVPWSDAPNPSSAALAHFVMTALDRFRDEPAIARALLALVGDHGDPGQVPQLVAFLRSRHPSVRAAAARTIVALDGHHLGYSVRRLLEDGDARVVRAAVEAVGAFGLEAHTEVVAAVLRHPKMALKKAAADALCALDASRVVPQLLATYAKWDNPGLRQSLARAYRHSATGNGPILEGLRRGQRGLVTLLDMRLTATDVWRLHSADDPVAPVLLGALSSRQIGLARGTQAIGNALLRGAGYETPTTIRHLPEAIRLDRTWSAPLIREALTRGPLPRDWSRRYGVHLVELLPSLDTTQRAHVFNGIDAVAWDHLSPDARSQVRERWTAMAPVPEVAIPVLQWLGRAGETSDAEADAWIDAVRRLPSVAGAARLRWGALVKLGASLSLADLMRVLADADLGPPTDRSAVLAAAFGISASGRGDNRWARELATASPEQRERLLAATSPSDHAAVLTAASLATRETGSDLLTWVCQRRPLGGPRDKVRPSGPRTEPPIAERIRNTTSSDERRELLDEALALRLDLRRLPHDVRLALCDVVDPESLRARMAHYLLASVNPERWRRTYATLFAMWGRGTLPTVAGRPVRAALDSVPTADLIIRVLPLVRTGHADIIDLLGRRQLTRDQPYLDLVEALRSSGRDADARALATISVAGVYESPEPHRRYQVPKPTSHDEALARLRAEAEGSDPVIARRALAALAAHGWGEPSWFVPLVTHADLKRRLAALRALKQVASPSTYLAAVRACLAAETRPDAMVTLIRTLGYARDAGAARQLVGLVEHAHAPAAQAATHALRGLGRAAERELHRARRRARPDRRAPYDAILAELSEPDDTTDEGL